MKRRVQGLAAQVGDTKGVDAFNPTEDRWDSVK